MSPVSESRLSSKIARNETNLSHQRQQCFPSFLFFRLFPFRFLCPFTFFILRVPPPATLCRLPLILCSCFCFVSDAARGRENSWLARNDYGTFMAEPALHTKPRKKGPPGKRESGTGRDERSYLRAAYAYAHAHAHHPTTHCPFPTPTATPHSIIRTSLDKVRKRLLERRPTQFLLSHPASQPASQME